MIRKHVLLFNYSQNDLIFAKCLLAIAWSGFLSSWEEIARKGEKAYDPEGKDSAAICQKLNYDFQLTSRVGAPSICSIHKSYLPDWPNEIKFVS